MKDNIRLLYVDLFCGAGGTSTGIEQATIDGQHCAKVVACVNHDAHAIESHAANHPDAMHFTEDIRTLNLAPLVAHLQSERAKHPAAKTVLWASLECTNFSRAKGGLPRDADSRTLAEHLFRYIEDIKPDFIQIENVEEFMSWGALDEHGKPISKMSGTDYVRWVENVKRYGYTYSYRLLNAADFGAYTSRKRFFGQFAALGLPHAFPEPTHSRNGGKRDLFGEGLNKWKAVREVLDLEDDGESIFGRKKPLVEKTLDRIYQGLIKFVAGGSIDNPCFTLIARMDKMPPYLIQTECGLAIEVYETDSPMTRKIKEFMALYGITDIKMRMLKISELKAIMGFPTDYRLVGTQCEQKKFIGNAVEVNMSRVLCEALAEAVEQLAA